MQRTRFAIACGVGVAMACGQGANPFAAGTSTRPPASSGASASSSSTTSSGEPTPDEFGSSGAPSSGAAASGGTSGAVCATTEAVPTKAKVDIIFVIDSSGSMAGEMAQIKQNVNHFAETIGSSGLLYQVIFIVTRGTPSDPPLALSICVPPPLGGSDGYVDARDAGVNSDGGDAGPHLRATCGDNPPVFHHINSYVDSRNSLWVVLNTYENMSGPLAWRQYLRPDAYKLFVEVSDDNSSLSAEAFDMALLDKLPRGTFGTAEHRKYIFHSISGWREGTDVLSTEKCATADGSGIEYRKLSKLTGGLFDSVCKTDYSGVLDNLATNTVDKFSCELAVPTSAQGDPTRMLVELTPPGGTKQTLTQVTDVSKCATFPNAWHYDDNTNPTNILLCPDACSASFGAEVKALVGCVAPPPR